MSGDPPGTQWLKAHKRRRRKPDPYAPGRVKGTLHLLPQFNKLGPIRPFGPGEWIDRGNGDWSSEETMNVPYNGGVAVLPSLWLVNGVPTTVHEDQAAQYAKASGLHWPVFPDENAANSFATNRENIWEQAPIGRSDLQSPLWSHTPQQPQEPGG